MPAHSKHPITLAEIAKIYRLTRQGAAWLVKRHGYPAATNPRWLLMKLLDGRACTLRTRLSDPAFRADAELSMGSAAFRCAIRPGTAIRKTKANP
jgi:hypothetical protein